MTIQNKDLDSKSQIKISKFQVGSLWEHFLLKEYPYLKRLKGGIKENGNKKNNT